MFNVWRKCKSNIVKIQCWYLFTFREARLWFVMIQNLVCKSVFFRFFRLVFSFSSSSCYFPSSYAIHFYDWFRLEARFQTENILGQKYFGGELTKLNTVDCTNYDWNPSNMDLSNLKLQMRNISEKLWFMCLLPSFEVWENLWKCQYFVLK